MGMNDAVILALAGSAGVLLGAAFFGGLWWTVRRTLASPRPALWIAGSLLLRTGIALAGFYVVSGGRWDRLTVCLLGFVVARVIVTRLAQARLGSDNARATEVSHAPQS
jgi:F1F0 ATPase subunit 2